jgi:hypothetical protein
MNNREDSIYLIQLKKHLVNKWRASVRLTSPLAGRFFHSNGIGWLVEEPVSLT